MARHAAAVAQKALVFAEDSCLKFCDLLESSVLVDEGSEFGALCPDVHKP